MFLLETEAHPALYLSGFLVLNHKVAASAEMNRKVAVSTEGNVRITTTVRESQKAMCFQWEVESARVRCPCGDLTIWYRELPASIS
jgi:hypothetical protein